MSRKIILQNFQSPGDVMMLTSAVRDLKKAFPEWKIDVRTTAMDIWENNPHLTSLDENSSSVEKIKCEYPLVNLSNSHPYHFIHAFRIFLEGVLKVRIPQGPFRGEIFLSEEEKLWMSQVEELGIKNKFWILMSGGKYDFTAKWWNPLEHQKVVDYFKNKILFVQCGEADHFHPKLNNTISLIGKTNTRQFIRLMYHAVGVVCPVTFAMHLSTAVESKYGLINRPTVVIAGGREPAQWEAYPHHRFLSLNGALKCCSNGGCWKSRCTKVGDGDDKDNDLCELPIEIDFKIKNPLESFKKNLIIPKCMDMIKAENVINAVESYYTGGMLEYDQ